MCDTDARNYPLHVMDNLGRHRTGTVLGSWRNRYEIVGYRKSLYRLFAQGPELEPYCNF